jgi:hypothetical protein
MKKPTKLGKVSPAPPNEESSVRQMKPFPKNSQIQHELKKQFLANFWSPEWE